MFSDSKIVELATHTTRKEKKFAADCQIFKNVVPKTSRPKAASNILNTLICGRLMDDGQSTCVLVFSAKPRTLVSRSLAEVWSIFYEFLPVFMSFYTATF